MPKGFGESTETTHYSIIDNDGNAVAVTYTLNGSFGAGVVADGTGILLNNEMDDFTQKPGVPNLYGLVQGEANAIQPKKTPLSSMSPTIVAKDGKPFMVIGSPGGSRIITITLEAIVNVIDHGMNIQEAIDAPRIHHQWLPDTVYIEPFGLSPDTEKMLAGMGYHLDPSDCDLGPGGRHPGRRREPGARSRRAAGPATTAPSTAAPRPARQSVINQVTSVMVDAISISGCNAHEQRVDARPVEQQRVSRYPRRGGAAEREKEAVAVPESHRGGHQSAYDEGAEHDNYGHGIFLEVVASRTRPYGVQPRQIVRIEGAGRPIFILTDRLSHHSFSANRQQIIKTCRAQPDHASLKAFDAVFNTL